MTLDDHLVESVDAAVNALRIHVLHGQRGAMRGAPVYDKCVGRCLAEAIGRL